MKNKSQSNSYAGQSKAAARTSLKHDVNVQKNSVLYFQIGLILCLLGTFGLFEMRFETKQFVIQDDYEKDKDIPEVTLAEVRPYVEEKTEIKNMSPLLPPEIEELPKEHPEIERKIFEEPKGDTTVKESLNPEDLPPIIKIPESVPVTVVEFVPIFPGCEKYELNSERKKCLNDKMGRLVRKKFDTDIAVNYGLSGVQRIFVEFKVDKSGEITDIKTRAPHPKLEEEALRLAHKIPKMQPGKMGTTPVNVIYNLPITFKVQD